MNSNLIIKSTTVVGFHDEFSEEVIIPDGITKIANNAFEKYYGLKRIILPSTLTSIGEAAFKKCSSLETISAPNSLAKIGDGAFRECTSLKTVDFSNTKIASIPYECFFWCKKLKSVQLPLTTLKIMERSFQGCTNLADLHINQGLKVIEDGFNECYSLTSLFIPSTLIHMEDISCRRNIRTVKTTKEQYERFREYLPIKCELHEVTIIDDMIIDFCENKDYEIEGTTLVSYNGEDPNVIIPYGITEIACEAFCESNIATIVFPNTVETICFSAFKKCMGLKRLILNEGLRTIGSGAFDGCKDLEEISLPKSLVSLEDCPFSNCNSVTIVNCNENDLFSFVDGCLVEERHIIIANFGNKIPEHSELDTIAEGAFSDYKYCYVTIPQNIKLIAAYAFLGCDSMESITINHDVEIESDAFSCLNLTSMVISSDCNSLEAGAFVVPHNNMLNIFVNGSRVPECVYDCVRYVRYRISMGELVDPVMKSGTHRILAADEWDVTCGREIPIRDVAGEGECFSAYYLGHGYDLANSALKIAIIIDTVRNHCLDIPNNPYRKIELTHAVVDDVDYVFDLNSDDLAWDILDCEELTFWLVSDDLNGALRDSDEIWLSFDILDSDGISIDGFSFFALL